jgi:hypothetical protein
MAQHIEDVMPKAFAAYGPDAAGGVFAANAEKLLLR